MNLKVAFQMDPLSSLNYAADTTVALIFEAHRRGFEIYSYEPRFVTWSNNTVVAPLHPLEIDRTKEPHLEVHKAQRQELSRMDVIWIRQNPPFDLGYFTNTFLLETLPSKTLIFNDPAGIRNAPEKILITQFSHLMPPTLITEAQDEIETFYTLHQQIILKPLYEFGGADILYLRHGDVNFQTLLEMMRKRYPRQPLMVQKFLPEVLQGDKRLLMVDGELVGGFKRIPASNSIRSNLVRGGQGAVYEPNKRDKDICQQLSPVLKKMGLFFVGLDIIGEYLTEINVTSPTGIHMVNQLNGIHVERLVWDKILENFPH